jgi:phosphatidate cytidylyltransferase
MLGVFGVVVLIAAAVSKARGRSVRSLLTKYVVWFAIIPAILVPLLTSRILFQVVVLLLSLQCLREFGRAAGLWHDRGLMRTCYLLTVAIYVPVFVNAYSGHQVGPILAVGTLVLLPIVRGQYRHMLQKVCLSMLAVLYFGWFLSHLAYLRNTVDGMTHSFFLLVLAACNDALAYLWGTWLGRHKLSPRLSPNKTIEGAVGGAASVVMIGVVLGGLLDGIGITWAVGAAGLIGVLGVCGDLVVSFIKRDLRIKDMGVLLPGHGGLLDRCDSLVLTAPVLFHLRRCFDGA